MTQTPFAHFDPLDQESSAVDPAVSLVGATSKTRADYINHWLTIIKDESRSVSMRRRTADDMIALRVLAKRSWKGLGFPELTDNGIRIMARVTSTKIPVSAVDPFASTSKSIGNGPADIARMFFNQENWARLRSHREKTQTTWSELGFNNLEIIKIESNLNG